MADVSKIAGAHVRLTITVTGVATSIETLIKQRLDADQALKQKFPNQWQSTVLEVQLYPPSDDVVIVSGMGGDGYTLLATGVLPEIITSGDAGESTLVNVATIPIKIYFNDKQTDFGGR